MHTTFSAASRLQKRVIFSLDHKGYKSKWQKLIIQKYWRSYLQR